MRQLPLDPFAANLNVTARLKATMRDAIKASGLSREEIAERMRIIAKRDGLGGGRGTTITLANLDAWVSETKDNLIPIHLLPTFCHVTRDLRALVVLAAPLGAHMIDARDRRILELARIEEESRRLRKRRTRILSEIGDSLDE